MGSQQHSKAAEPVQKEEKAFWMRDAATGDWIPEDHFGEMERGRSKREAPSVYKVQYAIKDNAK